MPGIVEDVWGRKVNKNTGGPCSQGAWSLMKGDSSSKCYSQMKNSTTIYTVQRSFQLLQESVTEGCKRKVRKVWELTRK